MAIDDEKRPLPLTNELILALSDKIERRGRWQEVDCRHWDEPRSEGDDVPHWGGIQP